jgi:hypothetical protein
VVNLYNITFLLYNFEKLSKCFLYKTQFPPANPHPILYGNANVFTFGNSLAILSKHPVNHLERLNEVSSLSIISSKPLDGLGFPG